MNLAPLPSTRPILEDNLTMIRETRTFMNAIARLSILEGTGSPEGVQSARATRFYMDTSGSTGNILYIKRVNSTAGDDKQGWILV